MIACDRVAALNALQGLGQQTCGYAFGQTWPLNTCDCKYGGPEVRNVIFGGKPVAAPSEKTGCPELRTVYCLLAAMTDDEWDGFRERAGMVTSQQLLEAFTRSPTQGPSNDD